jgi:hypothetical protein
MLALRTALASFAMTTFALAQTTGVPGINDYTVNGLTSGSMSCTTQCNATPVNLNLAVSTVPGNIVIFAFSFCPCFSGFACAGPNACLPAIPTTACGASTNQSLDIQLGCVTTFFAGVAGTAGATMTLSIPSLGAIPPCSVQLATQAIVIDTCGVGLSFLPGPFVLTQAYDLLFS